MRSPDLPRRSLAEALVGPVMGAALGALALQGVRGPSVTEAAS